MFGFGSKKQKQERAVKSHKKERWKGKTCGLERIISPSAPVAGENHAIDPRILDFQSLQPSGTHPVDPGYLDIKIDDFVSSKSGLSHSNAQALGLNTDIDLISFFDSSGGTVHPTGGAEITTTSADVCPPDPYNSIDPNLFPINPTAPGGALPGSNGGGITISPDIIKRPPVVLPVDPPGKPMVAVIETGFSNKNPYLNYKNITPGRDYVGNDNDPWLKPGEGNQHGTFMLGDITTIDPNAQIYAIRAIGSGRWADALREAVDYAQQSGHRNLVVNLSMDLTQVKPDGREGTRYHFTPPERAALEYARQNRVLIVVASGNDGGIMSALGQASQEFDNIISVGAANGMHRADYSSYGHGLGIMASGGTIEHPALSTAGDGLGTMAGTSVAAADVTGAASLIWRANPGLSYRQVIQILQRTATDLNTPGWDKETGFGLLNIEAAVQLAKQTEPENHPTPAIETFNRWVGEGEVTPMERAADTPYTIQSDDTLWDIAVQYLGNGNRWQEIKKPDGSTFSEQEAQNIQPGDVVYLPISSNTDGGGNTGGGNSGSPVAGMTAYTIQANDTLWGVAATYLGNGSRWQEIKKPDGATFSEQEAQNIQPGDVVYLPISGNTGGGNNTGGGGSTSSLGQILSVVPSSMRSFAETSVPLILAQCQADGVTDIGQIAYILATAQHESHLGQWMEELASGEDYEGRIDLGNTEPGDGVRFKGRGYVQITGRASYTYWSQRLGIDLVNYPEKASEPEIAAKILVQGMRDGTFTSKKLGDYINGSNRDFYNARRIVNGIDKANYIAQLAEGYLNALSSSGSSNSANTPADKVPTTGYRAYYVKANDYPSKIALQELGDADRWHEILKEDYTPLTEYDTTHLQVGQLLYLPFGYQSGSGDPVTSPPSDKPTLIRTGAGDYLNNLQEQIDSIEKDIEQIKKEIKDKEQEANKKAEDAKSKEWWTWLPWIKNEYDELKKEENEIRKEIDNLQQKEKTKQQEVSKKREKLQKLKSLIDSVVVRKDGMREAASSSIPLIFDECEARGLTKAEIAYILATSDHESYCGLEMTELSGYQKGSTDDKDYFSKYQGKYGNTNSGDGYKYRGRGYVQLTFKEVYQKLSDALGVDLVDNPDQAADPEIAAKIIVEGMMSGLITGLKLKPFMEKLQFDFARQVINGNMDSDEKVADIAKRYYALL